MYELICKEFSRRDTGVFFRSADEAIDEATLGDEVWQVADDVNRTRVMQVWPRGYMDVDYDAIVTRDNEASESAATREP